MLVFPAIDIRGGRCVRLLRGDYDRETVYGNDPVEMAQRFLEQGATHLHVVDLDGARSGFGENLKAVESIAKLGIKVQTGGGIRTQQDVQSRMDCGVFRIVIGTAAVENPSLVDWAVQRYKDAVAVGIDAKGGMVAVRGWEQQSTLTPAALGMRMKQKGITTVVYTQIERDGMQTGPDTDACVALANDTGLRVIVSGGVGSIDDIKAAADAQMYGIIIGKALYEGNVDLKQALLYQRAEV